MPRNRYPDDRHFPAGCDPDLDAFRSLARKSYASIPAKMRRYVEDVVIRIDDWPDPETLADMGCASRYDLLGLYRGLPVGQKSVSDVGPPADRIFLYREPILHYAQAKGHPVPAVIRHVLIHEIGHHFGLSDDDMARIEAEAEAEAESGD